MTELLVVPVEVPLKEKEMNKSKSADLLVN